MFEFALLLLRMKFLKCLTLRVWKNRLCSVWRRLWNAAFHSLEENHGDGARLSSAVCQEDKRWWCYLKQKRFRWGVRKKNLSTSTVEKWVTKRDCAVSILGSSQDPAGSALRSLIWAQSLPWFEQEMDLKTFWSPFQPEFSCGPEKKLTNTFFFNPVSVFDTPSGVDQHIFVQSPECLAVNSTKKSL